MKTKSIGWNFTSWSVIAFDGICGLLLLLWPDMALMIANYALASVLCLVGVAMVIGYIRAETMEGMLGYGLAKGLILLLTGIVLFANSDLLKSVLPFLWGVAMVAGGFGKFQMAFDLKRIGHQNWWVMLLGAMISFALGIFSVTQPAFIALVLTQFVGISLLVEAAMDIAAMLIMRHGVKHMKVKVTLQ